MALVKLCRGGESRVRRQRCTAAWLAGIAMSASLAAQANENDPNRTSAECRTEAMVQMMGPASGEAGARARPQRVDPPPASNEVEAPVHAGQNEAEAASEGPRGDTDVLVLQIEASYYRHLDQTSLVFRGDVVDLVTNNSGYQKGPVRLGWLRAPMSRDFESLRARIERYRARILNEETPTEPEFIPHAPVLRIGAVEISSRHPCFSKLERIFPEVWDIEWYCVDCATYERKGNSIVRTRTRNGEKRQTEVPPHLLETLWECGPVGLDTSLMGCADPAFGTFEIDDHNPPASAIEGDGEDGS